MPRPGPHIAQAVVEMLEGRGVFGIVVLSSIGAGDRPGIEKSPSRDGRV